MKHLFLFAILGSISVFAANETDSLSPLHSLENTEGLTLGWGQDLADGLGPGSHL